MYVTRAERRISLEKDFLDFLENRVGAESLDKDGDKERRPDFLWENQILIEVKTLRNKPSSKVDRLLEPERQSDDWPLVFGSLSERHLEGREVLQRNKANIVKRLESAVRDHTKKANKQILDYAKGRDQSYSGILVFLNECVTEYTPSLVLDAVHKEFESGTKTGRTAFTGIDRVIYISEAHFLLTPPANRTAYQITQLIGLRNTCPIGKPEKIIELWCQRGTGPKLTSYRGDGSAGNGCIEILPSSLPTHELWRIDYRKNCYLAGYTLKKLTLQFCKLLMLQLLAGHKDSPTSGTTRKLESTMVDFTHLLEEFSRRGTDMLTVVPHSAIQDKALRSLQLSESEFAFLSENFKFSANGEEYRPSSF